MRVRVAARPPGAPRAGFPVRAVAAGGEHIGVVGTFSRRARYGVGQSSGTSPGGEWWMDESSSGGARPGTMETASFPLHPRPR